MCGEWQDPVSNTAIDSPSSDQWRAVVWPVAGRRRAIDGPRSGRYRLLSACNAVARLNTFELLLVSFIAISFSIRRLLL